MAWLSASMTAPSQAAALGALQKDLLSSAGRMQPLLHGQEQAGHSRANASRLSLTRCRFWNVTVPEKLKGQLLSKLDVNRSLFLLHASAWIPQAMQSLLASGLQGSTHSTALPREHHASKEFPGGRKEQPGTEPRDEAEVFRHHQDTLSAVGIMNKHNKKKAFPLIRKFS